MRKQKEKIFYVYPEDVDTNKALRGTFETLQDKYIQFHQTSYPTYILRENQVAFLEKSKRQENLKYLIFTGNSETGYTLWNSPKAKTSSGTMHAILTISEFTKGATDEDDFILTPFRNTNQRSVKLMSGDYIIYDRVEKLLRFFKSGTELLTFAGQEGFPVTCENEALQRIEQISAVLNKKIQKCEYFRTIVFKIK